MIQEERTKFKQEFEESLELQDLYYLNQLFLEKYRDDKEIINEFVQKFNKLINEDGFFQVVIDGKYVQSVSERIGDITKDEVMACVEEEFEDQNKDWKCTIVKWTDGDYTFVGDKRKQHKY